jgi:hypothetical protein
MKELIASRSKMDLSHPGFLQRDFIKKDLGPQPGAAEKISKQVFVEFVISYDFSIRGIILNCNLPESRQRKEIQAL